MKFIRKLVIAVLAITLSNLGSFAQTPFTIKDSLNINNINATVLLHGDMWWDPTEQLAKCEYPKGSGKNIGFASAIWMSGYDDAGQLHTAAQTYRQDGNDYWPGPLYPTDTLLYTTSASWARFWKVSRPDVQDFLALPVHTLTNTPEVILHWPAKGNANAGGFGGVPITVPNNMAPFIDLNGNGIYEPLLGEYPDFKGDQAIWWVFSDNGPTHQQTNGKPLGVEIQVLNYGYNRNTLIDNVVYYEYTIVNRSANTYHNYRFGQWADMDLGFYLDDYIGFDSSHRMGIVYNGIPNDGAGGGFPANSYGTHIPMAGITMIALPGDSPTNYIPAGSFVYYRNDASIIGNPSSDTDFNHYLRGRMGNGQHFNNSHAAGCTVSDTNSNYVFTGDPGDTTQCSECSCNNAPGDRRFVIASNDFTLLPGSSYKVVMALITTNPDTLNTCPNGSFDSIKIYADTAWKIYFNPLPNAGISEIVNDNGISVYPNPAYDKLFITDKNTPSDNWNVVVYNTFGQSVVVPVKKDLNTAEININNLIPGIYYLQYKNGNHQKSITFVKK